MESADVLKQGQRENLPFPIGELVQRTRGLYGADIGVVLAYDHQNFADPLENTHVVVGGVVLFGPADHSILPDDEYKSWPIHVVKLADKNYQERYQKLKR